MKTGPTDVEVRRAQRHASRTASTYNHFLNDIAEVSGFTKDQAERAAVATVSALESRIMGGEARNLSAQLPYLLQEQLRGLPQREGVPVRKLKKSDFLELVGSALGLDEEGAERAIRAVLEVLSGWIAPAEVLKVVHTLPADLRALWPADVLEDVEHLQREEAAAGTPAQSPAPQASWRDALSGYAEHLLTLPQDAQLGFLHMLMPRVLAMLPEQAREGFVRELLSDVGRAERGEPTYELDGGAKPTVQ